MMLIMMRLRLISTTELYIPLHKWMHSLTLQVRLTIKAVRTAQINTTSQVIGRVVLVEAQVQVALMDSLRLSSDGVVNCLVLIALGSVTTVALKSALMHR